MSEDGAAPKKLSYLEQMRRAKAHNDRVRARQLGPDFAKSSQSMSALPTYLAETSSSSKQPVRLENKENHQHDGGSDQLQQQPRPGSSCSTHDDVSLLHESHAKANKSAPAGDMSSLAVSMMSEGGGDQLQRSVLSSIGDCSKNTSGGSSVVDMPREAGGSGSAHNSLLSSFMNRPEESRLESFSRPHPVPKPRSRVMSECMEKERAAEEYVLQPPPVLQQQQPAAAADRFSRPAAANGSFLRSKSAAAMPPHHLQQMAATPAFSRSSSILSGLAPRTPAVCQTPSFCHRLSMSSLSLNPANVMVVKGKEYVVQNVIGKGGSSKVFQAFEAITNKNVAIKEVDLSGTDDSTREAFINEIELLRKLQGSNYVITMHDYELVEEEDKLLVVMERGETDLSTYLKRRHGAAGAEKNTRIGNFVRYWWEEMLRAVQFVHEHNVVHMDLKPANFLLVEGMLKLIDFGIASSIPSNKTSIIKDSQMGTLSYMSPESLMDAEAEAEGGERGGEEADEHRFKVTAKADVWSLGCILYTMVYGRRPFDRFQNMRAKIRAITDPSTRITYEPTDDPLIEDVLKRCLVHDVKKRASVAELLQHPYLKSPAGSSAAAAAPPAQSPISEDALQQLTYKMQACTPRTATQHLKSYMEKVQRKKLQPTAAAAAAASPPPPHPRQKTVLELESPPSTK